MPIYDYSCKKCGKKFSLTMPIIDYEKKSVRCPKCNTTQVEQELKRFYAVTSKKS